jgi:hypothetical protein
MLKPRNCLRGIGVFVIAAGVLAAPVAAQAWSSRQHSSQHRLYNYQGSSRSSAPRLYNYQGSSKSSAPRRSAQPMGGGAIQMPGQSPGSNTGGYQ